MTKYDDERLEENFYAEMSEAEMSEEDKNDWYDYGPEEDHETEERTDNDPDEESEPYSQDDLMGRESETPLEEALSLEEYEEDRKIDNLINQCEPPEGDIDYPL